MWSGTITSHYSTEEGNVSLAHPSEDKKERI